MVKHIINHLFIFFIYIFIKSQCESLLVSGKNASFVAVDFN